MPPSRPVPHAPSTWSTLLHSHRRPCASSPPQPSREPPLTLLGLHSLPCCGTCYSTLSSFGSLSALHPRGGEPACSWQYCCASASAWHSGFFSTLLGSSLASLPLPQICQLGNDICPVLWGCPPPSSFLLAFLLNLALNSHVLSTYYVLVTALGAEVNKKMKPLSSGMVGETDDEQVNKLTCNLMSQEVSIMKKNKAR